jgi:hypothetical protein
MAPRASGSPGTATYNSMTGFGLRFEFFARALDGKRVQGGYRVLFQDDLVLGGYLMFDGADAQKHVWKRFELELYTHL